MIHETIAPTSGLLTGDIQLDADLLIIQTPGGQQHNARSFCSRTDTLRLLLNRSSSFRVVISNSTVAAFLIYKLDVGKPITLH